MADVRVPLRKKMSKQGRTQAERMFNLSESELTNFMAGVGKQSADRVVESLGAMMERNGGNGGMGGQGGYGDGSDDDMSMGDLPREMAQLQKQMFKYKMMERMMSQVFNGESGSNGQNDPKLQQLAKERDEAYQQLQAMNDRIEDMQKQREKEEEQRRWEMMMENQNRNNQELVAKLEKSGDVDPKFMELKQQLDSIRQENSILQGLKEIAQQNQQGGQYYDTILNMMNQNNEKDRNYIQQMSEMARANDNRHMEMLVNMMKEKSEQKAGMDFDQFLNYKQKIDQVMPDKDEGGDRIDRIMGHVKGMMEGELGKGIGQGISTAVKSKMNQQKQPKPQHHHTPPPPPPRPQPHQAQQGMGPASPPPAQTGGGEASGSEVGCPNDACHMTMFVPDEYSEAECERCGTAWNLDTGEILDSYNNPDAPIDFNQQNGNGGDEHAQA